MKFKLLLVSIFISLNSFGQQADKFKMKFVKSIDFEVAIGKNEEKLEIMKRPVGLAVNMYAGLHFTRYLLFSFGTGIVKNYNNNFIALPVIADLRWFLSEYGSESSPYIFLNTGRYIDIGDGFEDGQTAKLGLGYLSNLSNNTDLLIELFKNSRTFYQEPINNIIDGVGLGIGLRI